LNTFNKKGTEHYSIQKVSITCITFLRVQSRTSPEDDLCRSVVL